jgi:hypothetical protein
MSIEHKIGILIEEAVKEAGDYEIQLDGPMSGAVAYKYMTPEERQHALSDKYVDGPARMEALKGLGDGLVTGGLVAGGTALANETMGTNFDPVLSGLGTAALTGGANAIGRYSDESDERQSLQDNILAGKYLSQDKKFDDVYRKEIANQLGKKRVNERHAIGRDISDFYHNIP